jgi:hypothetical protein
MGMKIIISIVILILQPIAFAEDKSELHWTQKIFIKEKKSSVLEKKEIIKCQNFVKENSSGVKNQEKLLSDECNEKKI